MSRVHDILGILAENPDKAMTAAQLATKTKHDVKDVNAALSNWVRTHTDTPVVKLATGIWRWDSAAAADAPASAAPMSAAPNVVKAAGGWVAPESNALALPVVGMNRGGVQYGDVHCEFTVVKEARDVVVLSREGDGSIWIAKPV